jgi:hypothetical protein
MAEGRSSSIAASWSKKSGTPVSSSCSVGRGVDRFAIFARVLAISAARLAMMNSESTEAPLCAPAELGATQGPDAHELLAAGESLAPSLTHRIHSVSGNHFR